MLLLFLSASYLICFLSTIHRRQTMLISFPLTWLHISKFCWRLWLNWATIFFSLIFVLRIFSIFILTFIWACILLRVFLDNTILTWFRHIHHFWITTINSWLRQFPIFFIRLILCHLNRNSRYIRLKAWILRMTKAGLLTIW